LNIRSISALSTLCEYPNAFIDFLSEWFFFSWDSAHGNNNPRGGEGYGGWRPGEKGTGYVRKAGEEGAGSGIPKVAGRGRKRGKITQKLLTLYKKYKKAGATGSVNNIFAFPLSSRRPLVFAPTLLSESLEQAKKPAVCTTLNGGRGTVLRGVKYPKNYCPRLQHFQGGKREV